MVVIGDRDLNMEKLHSERDLAFLQESRRTSPARPTPSKANSFNSSQPIAPQPTSRRKNPHILLLLFESVLFLP